MQVNNFIKYIDSPDERFSVSENEILPIINEFPYCQTGQLMYAIQLNSNNSILFENQLKKTAAICPDRTKLFEHIHPEIKAASASDQKEEPKILGDDKFIPTEGKDELDLLEKEYVSQAINSTILLESSESIDKKTEPIKEVKLFDEKISHSFSSWLKHYSGDDDQIISSENRKENHRDIIDKFIQEDPRIEPKKTEFFSPTNMARLSVTDTGIVSETLALIYVDQGNHQEAINAYEKLMLKNPKKSTYFASQIKILKQKLKQ